MPHPTTMKVIEASYAAPYQAKQTKQDQILQAIQNNVQANHIVVEETISLLSHAIKEEEDSINHEASKCGAEYCREHCRDVKKSPSNQATHSKSKVPFFTILRLVIIHHSENATEICFAVPVFLRDLTLYAFIRSRRQEEDFLEWSQPHQYKE